MEQPINEPFTSEESQEIYQNFKTIINSRLDKLYNSKGSDGEQYAYSIAVKQMRKKQAEKLAEPTTEEPMEQGDKLKEMIQSVLSKPLSEKKKSFPDLTGDGKVTKADILKARGVELDEDLDLGHEDDKPHMLKGGLNKMNENTGLKKGDTVEFEGTKYKIGSFDTEANLVYLDTMNGKPAEDSKGSYLKVNATRVKPSMNEDLDLGHTDDEPHMLKADLYRIGKYAMELYKMVDQFEGEQEVDFPHWWQAKIIEAKNMLISAKHYLDFEIKEPQLDAMVDVASEEGAIDEMSKKQIKKRGEIFDTLTAKGMPDEKAGKIATSTAMKKKIKEAILAKLK